MVGLSKTLGSKRWENGKELAGHPECDEVEAVCTECLQTVKPPSLARPPSAVPSRPESLICCQHGQRELATVGSTRTLSRRAVITANVGRCS